MKSMFQRFTIFCLIAVLLPMASFNVKANDTSVEFIKNGGFETATDNGGPSDWSYGSGLYSVDYILDKENQLSGQNCLKLSATTTDLYIYQSAAGLAGGTPYTLTVNVKPVSYSGSAVRIKLEYLTINSAGKSEYVGEYNETLAVLKNCTWQKKVLTVTPPANAYSARIMFRLQTTSGLIYFDDLSFTGEKVAEYVPDIDPGTLPVFEDKAMAEGASELIGNGGFEQGALGWSSSDSSWQSYTTLSDTVYRGSGGRSVRISTAEKNKPFVTYRVQGVTPLCEYQASVYIRSNLLQGDGFGFKYEYLDGSGKVIKEELSGRFKYITGVNWVKYTVLFVPPPNCASVRILFRLFGTGTLYIDDASCYKTEEAYYLRLETDKVFYYTDEAEGKATATVNTYSYPFLATAAIDFKLTYNGAVVKQQAAVPVNGEGYAGFTFNISDLGNEKSEYKIEVSVMGIGGEESAAVYRYDRPSALTEDGVYLKNGKPFDPIFAYHVGTDSYPLMAQAGINVVQGQPSRADLDKALENGLMVLVVLYRDMNPAGHPINEARTREIVADLMDHPAVFAWAIMDEPFSNDPGSEPYLKNSYKIIRDIDPVHPVFVMEVGEKLDIAVKYADLFGIDPYVGGGVPATHVAEKTAGAFSVSDGKPIYNLLQAFSYNGYFPTQDEMRSMIYQGLWAGSKAIGYYCFDTSLGSIPMNRTELWPALMSWYSKESAIAFEHFVHNPDSLIAKSESADTWWRTWKRGSDIFALVLNRSNAEAKTAEIPLPKDLAVVSTEALGGAENGSISTGNNLLTVSVGAGAAALYKVETTDNLMINHSFEKSGGESWSKSGISDISSVIMTDGDCPDGNNYVKFSNFPASAWLSQRNYSLEPASTYVMSLWYKSSSANKALIKIQYNDPDFSGASPQFKIPASAGWTKFSVAFTTPEGIDPSKGTDFMLRLNGSISGTQYLCYDGIELKKADSFVGFCENQTLTEVTAGEFDRFSLYNIGKSITEYPKGVSSVGVHFFSETDKNAVVFTALYKNKNGFDFLESISCTQVTGDSYGSGNAGDTDSTHVAKINATIPAYESLEEGSYKLKAFVFNSLSGMNPMTKTDIINFVK